LGYNIGYDYFGKGNGNLTYSLVFGIGVNDKAGIYVETFGSYIDFEMNEVNFDAGLTYLVMKNLQLDFSFGNGINTDLNYLAAGFSWLIME